VRFARRSREPARFPEVYRQAGIIAAQQLFCGELVVHRISAQQAWENSVACALAMEWLARHRQGDDANAYAIGLLRPVGKIVLNRVLIERPTVWCVYPGEAVEPAVHMWELRMFGLSAPEVAAILMRIGSFRRACAKRCAIILNPCARRELG